MTDSSVRVPEISTKHDGREIDCIAYNVGGVIHYKQRVESINFLHQKVHEGRFFSGGYFNLSVPDGGNVALLIQSSATLSTHLEFAGASGGDSIVQLFEDTTFSNAGTTVTMSNHNRLSTKVGDGTVTHTPTILTNGNQINGTVFVAGGQKAQSGGGSGGFDNEFILNLNTVYLILITNLAGQAKPMSIMVSGYQPEL